MINYIAAARAAQQQGAIDRRDHYLNLATGTGAGPALGIAQAELQMEQRQTEQAYATLRDLDTGKRGQDKVKLMLMHASTELKEWEQSLTALEQLERNGAVPAEQIWAKQMQAWGAILNKAADTGDVQDLNNAWQRVPKKLKQELYLTEVYVSGRLRYPETADCEALLRPIIRDNPDPALVRLYGLVQAKDTDKQIALIEHLLAGHERHSMLLLTAGRLYKRRQLWGKARSALEESIKTGPTADAYYELATMLESQGDVDAANQYFRQGLALSAASTSIKN
jgi:HemY protein